MRLILISHHLPFTSDQIPILPENTFLFASMEDFTVGPLEHQHDPARFEAGRSKYWMTTPAFDLPDGSKMDYYQWHGLRPQISFAELAHLSKKDFPVRHEFADLVPKARVIELWVEPHVSSILWQWYVVAEMNRLGIPQNRITLRHLNNISRYEEPTSTWEDLFLNAPNTPCPATPISPRNQGDMLSWWNTASDISAGKTPSTAELTPADDAAQQVFTRLLARRPDPKTGLNDIQTRLLKHSKPEWAKMPRVVGEAMAEGYGENDYTGDDVVVSELKNMARRDPPLVEVQINNDPEGRGAMRYCTTRLTSEGEILKATLPT